MSDDFRIPATLWYDPQPSSPKFTQAFANLAFTLQPGQSANGPSVALLGVYELGWPYTELYGEQLPKPVTVVAIHSTSGQVFLSDLNPAIEDEEEDAILPLMSDEDAAGPGPARNALRESGYFNVDLCALLNLPPDQAYYQVFLWLDDLVTPIQTVQVPANPARKGTGQSPYEVKNGDLLAFGASPKSPKAVAGVIRTDLDFQAGKSYRVQGTLPPGALDTPPTGGASGSPVLTVLAFDRQSRLYAWNASTAAYGKMKSSAAPYFNFDPFRLISQPRSPENIYVVTVLGNVRNEVLVIFTDYQRAP
ncbi:hypothetical protein JRI60_52310 [Archangium violaceum]|uniref:hypothetical protein n=1 Tax=Archangium violaceum TaxID=83451 RepID=UPI0019507530|nr:hypothetical protein [Archangium violaceum]QRN97431.1 hypothetical protein JRI60_52310 [Archangium violaceum]